MTHVLRNALRNGQPTPGPNYLADYEAERDRFTIVDDPSAARQFSSAKAANEWLHELPKAYHPRWLVEPVKE